MAKEDHDWKDGKCTKCDYECQHNGGKATCSQKAICEICGSPYGEFDSKNHKVADDWTQEGRKHYHKCAYGCNQRFDETDCSGGTATCTMQPICEVCKNSYGSVNPDNHTGKAVWTATAKTHSKAYDCCGASVIAKEDHDWKDGSCTVCGYKCEHKGGKATCTKKAICEICGQPYGRVNPDNHNPTKAWEQENGKHYHACQNGCGKHLDEAACFGGTATCKDKATCEVCGKSYGELNPDNHTGEIVWTRTATSHSSAYDCCGKTVVAKEAHTWKDGVCTVCGYGCEHRGGEATCIKRAVCEDCGKSYGKLNPKKHAGSAAWTQTATAHQKVYSCCNAAAGEKQLHEWKDGTCTICGYQCRHKGGVATCSHKAVCDICNTPYGDPDADNHKAADEWTQEKGKHYHKCLYGCDTHLNEADCSGGTATCTEKAVCKTCEKPYGSVNLENHTGKVTWTQAETSHSSAYNCCGKVVVAEEAHAWKDGTCSACGYKCQHKGGIATCTKKAICELCGTAYGETNATNHPELVKIDAQPATHLAQGNIEYWQCTACKKYFNDGTGSKEISLKETVIPKLSEHAADNTGWHYDDNNHWNICKCGEVINKDAHAYGDWKVTLEPTTTAKGEQERTCTVCGKVETQDIPAVDKPTEEKPEQRPSDKADESVIPQTGDSVQIPAAVASFAGIAAFAVAYITYKRHQ